MFAVPCEPGPTEVKVVFSFLAIPPLALPRAIFDGICEVLCTSSTLRKWAVCYMAIAPGPGPTEAKIQTPNGPFGFWGLEFGVWILDFWSWILDFGFWILDLGFWILDLGFWSLDFGFWISLVFVLLVVAPNGPVWILEFGFWIRIDRHRLDPA